jgi:2-oxoglutarate ferredoxin oxidoreductase subunit alpha
MNPAALKANLADLPRGGDAHRRHRRVHQAQPGQGRLRANPLEDGSLDGYHVHAVPLTTLTVEALEGLEASPAEAERAKNMFALGLLSWLYGRPTEGTIAFLSASSPQAAEIAEANIAAFRAGYNFGETTEAFAVSYEVKPAPMPPGTYRNITGNQALALRAVAAGSARGCRCSSAPTRSRRRRTSCTSCPSTSASACARSRPRTRSPPSAPRSAPRSAARSASPRRPGPGIALKSETIGLA